MNDYGLNIWGNSNFTIDGGKLCLNSDFKQPLVDIIKEIRADGVRGPILLRFQGRNEKGKMNPKSEDKEYMRLLSNLKEAMEALRLQIVPKVYEYGFLMP